MFAADAWIEDPVGSPRLLGHDAIGEAVERVALPQRGLLDDTSLFGP